MDTAWLAWANARGRLHDPWVDLSHEADCISRYGPFHRRSGLFDDSPTHAEFNSGRHTFEGLVFAVCDLRIHRYFTNSGFN
jgi:hypothetical protein